MKIMHDEDGYIWIKHEDVKRKRSMDRHEWEFYKFALNEGRADIAKKWRESHEYWYETNENIWSVSCVGREGGYDGYLMKTFLPLHMSNAEWSAFKDEFWISFYNPYEDGRDCTGAKFSSWMERYDVPKGTWVYHKVSFDV